MAGCEGRLRCPQEILGRAARHVGQSIGDSIPKWDGDYSMAMRKAELARMTWAEAKDAFQTNPVILVPMGSCEEHGPAVPVGDYRYMAHLARHIGEHTGAIACPAIPWGYSEDLKAFPGTLTIRPETLAAILEDHLDCLLRFGLDHIMFVVGHRGDLPIVEHVARKVRAQHHLRVASMEPLAWYDDEWKRHVYTTTAPHTGHGTDPMQSLAMYLYPDEVRLDLIQPGNEPAWRARPFRGTSDTFTEEHVWHLYLNYDEVSANGVVGDVTLPNANIGQRTMTHLIDIGCQIVREFAKVPTRC